ncbi:hypothetical protein Barb6XT_01206 [Bacteroidales bacterium Barb6XT]|nr:hypothetical protein Barb6XT_01206 [Bacteroidales bacterium Barb6XT]
METKQTVIPPAEKVKDDTCYTKEEWEAKLARAFAEMEAGQYIILTEELQKEMLGL